MNYKLKWAIIGSVFFALLSFTTLFFHFLIDMDHFDFHWNEFLSIFILGLAGSVFGYGIGSYKEKDMARAGFLRELSKDFLHDARSHLSIIIGVASILNESDYPVDDYKVKELLPKVIDRAEQLSLLIKENLQLIEEFESKKDAK